MRIAVLNPTYGHNFVRVARWAAKSRGRVQRHPEYLLTAIQVLLDAGHEVRFIDAAARNLSFRHVLADLKKFSPQMLVIHATTPSIYNDIDQAQEIKTRTRCQVVFIGQHVTAEPDNTFKLGFGVVDCIARGEYDYTLRDLANGQAIPQINGLTWHNGQKVVRNLDREPLDVNELPFPAWHLIRPEWYPDAGKKYPFLTLMTGRGCNNACSFCRDPQLMYGYRLRMRSAQKVADEMEYDLDVHPKIREIMFETDTFAADADHVREVCREIMARDLHKRICWSCNMRIDTDLTLLPLMREAGCRMLMVGYEFGYDQAFRAVRKGGVNVQMAREFSIRAHEQGFTVHGCFMIGAPGETRETARATIDFAKSLPLDTIQITGIAVYPGTRLYTWAKENGYLLANDWSEWLTAEREQKTLLSYPQLSHEEINELIDVGLKEFYLRPRQIIAMLFSIRSLGDLLRKIYGLKAFLSYFVTKALKVSHPNDKNGSKASGDSR